MGLIVSYDSITYYDLNLSVILIAKFKEIGSNIFHKYGRINSLTNGDGEPL